MFHDASTINEICLEIQKEPALWSSELLHMNIEKREEFFTTNPILKLHFSGKIPQTWAVKILNFSSCNEANQIMPLLISSSLTSKSPAFLARIMIQYQKSVFLSKFPTSVEEKEPPMIDSLDLDQENFVLNVTRHPQFYKNMKAEYRIKSPPVSVETPSVLTDSFNQYVALLTDRNHQKEVHFFRFEIPRMDNVQKLNTKQVPVKTMYAPNFLAFKKSVFEEVGVIV